MPAALARYWRTHKRGNPRKRTSSRSNPKKSDVDKYVNRIRKQYLGSLETEYGLWGPDRLPEYEKAKRYIRRVFELQLKRLGLTEAQISKTLSDPFQAGIVPYPRGNPARTSSRRNPESWRAPAPFQIVKAGKFWTGAGWSSVAWDAQNYVSAGAAIDAMVRNQITGAEVYDTRTRPGYRYRKVNPRRTSSRSNPEDLRKLPKSFGLPVAGWKKVPSVWTGGKPFFLYHPKLRARIVWNRQTRKWESQIDNPRRAPRAGSRRQPIRRRNPPARGAELIYPEIVGILARKSPDQPHHCDAKCRRAGHLFEHRFKRGSGAVYGDPSGRRIIIERR
jgi:hypothetical protein